MVVRAIALLALFAPSAWAQSMQAVPLMAPELHPGFEVATIKPTDPDSTRGGFPIDGAHVAIYGQTLDAIVSVAYGVHIRQVVDGPEWASKERFDIEGIADQPGVPSFPQLQEMYRQLLAERFHLKIRREQRPMSFFAITVAKGGPLLKPAQPGESLNAANLSTKSARTLKCSNMPLPVLAMNLNFYEDRPVIDRTGLPGAYDFTLTWTFDLNRDGDADAPASLFTAMREQLGLKVEAVKGPAEVLVVESAERPSPN